MGINLTQNHINGGWARYLPAISNYMVTHLGKDLSDPSFIPKNRVPKKFEYGIQGLDFFKSENSYYNYDFALYSAGHAERNLAKCVAKEPMIHNRDRERTILVGDSSGFQIATGVLKLDWATVKGPEGDILREQILRWLEFTSDWSMTLDVPAIAADPPFNRKTGLTNFNETLDVTEHNLHYFIKNRVPGKTKFLNVISGTTLENSKEWYETIKHFSIPSSVESMGYTSDRTLEGFAFAGINMRQMESTLNRILDLVDDNLLHDKDWIHFLGVGRLDWACYLTSIVRQLRKRFNPNINFSFDAASPYVSMGGYALLYDYNYFSPQKLTYSMERCVDDKLLSGSTMAMPFTGPIMSRLTVGDMCVRGPNDVDKNGKIRNTSFDSTSYALGMAHNVYNHIHAVQEINRLADIEYERLNIDYRDWMKNERKMSSNRSVYVPNSILYFNNFVEVLFDPATKDPRAMVKDYANVLKTISFGKTKTFDMRDLFHMEESTPNVDDLASMDSDYLSSTIQDI